MTRRDFLKNLLGVGVTAAVPFGFLQWFKLKPKPLSHEQIIERALDTPEGRDALAKAMVEPIKTSLMHQTLERKLLMVTGLPQGVLPRYK